MRKLPDSIEKMPSYNRRIFAFRRAWHWSQAALADALRVHRATIARWERGERAASWTDFMACVYLQEMGTDRRRAWLEDCRAAAKWEPGQPRPVPTETL